MAERDRGQGGGAPNSSGAGAPGSSRTHDHHWATEQIALGSVVCEPDHIRAIRRAGITHVLDCRKLEPLDTLYLGTGIIYRQYGVLDDGKPKPDEWFHQGVEFALQALQGQRSRVLVHCRFGMSRAPSMVYAILRALGMGSEEAATRIKNARVVAAVTYRADADRAIRAWERRRRF
jgi:protein-tyrosine phosphatase